MQAWFRQPPNIIPRQYFQPYGIIDKYSPIEQSTRWYSNRVVMIHIGQNPLVMHTQTEQCWGFCISINREGEEHNLRKYLISPKFLNSSLLVITLAPSKVSKKKSATYCCTYTRTVSSYIHMHVHVDLEIIHEEILHCRKQTALIDNEEWEGRLSGVGINYKVSVKLLSFLGLPHDAVSICQMV